MTRLSNDEPEDVGILGKPFTFWHQGLEYQAEVSKTNLGASPFSRGFVLAQPLEGAFGRAWLVDPCTMALHDSLHRARLDEGASARADRAARRKAKGELAQEAAQAKSSKPSKW